MSEVLVRYSYTAEQEDELSLKVGDVIRNVVTMDGGWWEGELNGKKGVFPDNFVEITKGNDKDEGEGTKLNHKPSTKSHVAQLANKLKDGVHIGSTGAPKKRVSPHMKKKKQKAKVKHQYTAEHEDELSLEIDEVIDVIEKVEDGWMKGTLNGKQGLFPSNFVDLYEEDEETEKADEPKKEPEDEFKEIKGKKVQGVGLGNIFGSGPIKLKSTATITKRGSQHIDSESKDEKTAVNTEVARREKGQTTEKAIVRYSYTAVHEDELSLSVGDVVNIVDREIEDSGWWKGEVSGKTGVFPDNFVELLPEPKTKGPVPALPAVGNSKVHTGNDDAKAERTLSPTEPEKSFSKKKDSLEPLLNDRVPPAVPAKKPILPPPPVGKKPMHQRSTEMLASKGKVSPEPKRLDELETRVTRTGKGRTDKDKTESLEMNFDSIEPHPDKLSHLTANRARLPAKRRPPSTVFIGNGEENGLDLDVKKESSPAIEEEPQEKPVIKETGVGKRAVNLRPAPHPIIPHTTASPSYLSSNSSSIASKRASFLSSSTTPTATTVATTISSLTKTSSVLSKTSGVSPSITSDSKAGSHIVLKSETVHLPPGAASVQTGKTPVDQSVLENLKKELQELRTNSVSKATYNELKSEMDKLRKDLEFIKTSYSRKFMDLTHEIDEEKKIRLNTQVELDRLKKIVTESSI